LNLQETYLRIRGIPYFDTETTWLRDNDIIIEVTVIDLDANTLIETLVKPTKRKSIPIDCHATLS
jgi:hypothetical protein